MKKFIKTFMSFGLIAAVFAMAPLASANYSINTHPNDCQTVSIANYTTGEGIDNSCWPRSNISASVGQVINVVIYYHNSGNTPATNVSFQMTDPMNQTIGANGTISFTGKILVGGSVVKQGTVTANISGGPSHLVLGNVMRYDRAAAANLPVPNGNTLFSSGGLQYGTMGTTDNDQGAIKASFTVVADNNPNPNPCTTGCGQNGQAPTVTTNAAMPVTMVGNLGNATLNGYFNSNGAETITSFHYRLVGSSNWITVDMQNRGISSGNLQYQVTGLSSGTYEFEAVATNQYGTRTGGIMTFVIGNGTTSCGTGYYWNGSVCVQNIPTCGSNQYWNGSYCVTNIPTCSYNQYWNGSYCVTNIPTCSYNQYWNGSSCVNTIPTCSYNQYWNGSQCVTNIAVNTAPTVTTLGTISIGNTSVAVDGYYTSTTCDVYTHFNYGITQNLGSVTGEVNRGTGSGSMAQSFAGLASNTTYYYQAAVRNCQGSAVGEIRSFRTTQTTVINNTTTIIDTTNIGGGNSFIKLMIDNHRSTVSGDRDIAYDVSWENITNRTLKNLIIEVNFPTQMTIVDTDHGSIERNEHSVVYQIDTLGGRESGEMVIVTRVNAGLREGDPVVAQAIAAFENPKTGTAENAIAYDADSFSLAGSVLGASIFGLNFLPNSLVGWLIILLIILLIIIVAHAYSTRHRAAVVAINNQSPRPMDAGTPGATPGNDYIVYRPNPKQ